jgi:hypothetical protein
MNKKKYLLCWLPLFCCFSLLYTNELFAEKLHIKLEWNDTLKKINTTNSETLALISFAGSYNGENDNFLPTFQKEIAISRVGNITCVISNARYESVINNAFAGADKVSSDVLVKAIGSYYKKQPKGVISLLPLRKNASSGNIEKLIECDIEYSISASSSSAGEGRDYVNNSVLSSGNWYKIAIPASGMYKMDYNFLSSKLNINMSTLNLGQIGIFGEGGGMLPEKCGDSRTDDLKELSIKIVDNNNNGKIDNDDYIYFYAEGPLTWRYNGVSNRFEHTLNLYDTKTYYYFTPDRGISKQASPQASTAGGTLITSFDDYAVYESEKTNFLKSGRTWYGKPMTNIDNVLPFTMDFVNLVSGSTANVRSVMAARSTTTSSNLSLSINGGNVLTHIVSTVPIDYTQDYARNDELSRSFIPSSSNLNLNYTFSNLDNSAIGWLDFVEVNVKRNLSFSGSFLPFQTATNVGTGLVSKFQLANTTSSVSIWDITNLFDAREQQTNQIGTIQEFSLTTPILRHFISFDRSASATFTTPSFIEKIDNQDLHSLAASHPDMIIVAPKDLATSADNLANLHRLEGLSVEVIRTDQLYNEFSGGTADPTAIRDFMKLLYDKAGSNFNDLPQYLLLYADASFDPQTGRTQDEKNLIPTYESINSVSPTSSYCSDDYFGCLDNLEGGDMNSLANIMDVSVGRIPVRSVEEANGVNNKIFHYKSANSFGNWRSTLTYVADDEDNNTHVRSCDLIAERIRNAYPMYNIDKIYLDAFREERTPAGDRYPDVNNAIKNKLFQGSLIFNWIGHGGVQNWAHERIFDVSDINALKNIDKLPLFFTATCDFSKFDEEGITTAGERLLTVPGGGAIALITTVRLVYSSSNDALNSAFSNIVFEPYLGRKPTMGELVMSSKNNLLLAISADPINTRKFTLLGDPALTLNYPEYSVATTKINNRLLPSETDTLSALEYISIEGEVRDASNTKLNSFNGEIFPTVYDKSQHLKTLANDGGDVFDFELQKNAIFKGKASVTNGAFSFSFIVPKDIDYSIGIGKISYYADNGITDAAGYSFNAYVGGVADSFGTDNEGPKILLYMNDEKFVFGGTTDEKPILLIKLEDNNGINTAGLGIGHDISCVLDKNEKSKIALNDFYEGELNNYKKGNVKYPFYNLSEGKHDIEVKAWDVFNNSSTAYSEFYVSKSATLALKHVLNYPNPFTTNTRFMFEHNRAGDNLDVNIQIFTVAGKIVKTIQANIASEGYRVDNIQWDGRDDFGDKIGRGIYIYKVSVRTSEGLVSSQFEKLVILQ